MSYKSETAEPTVVTPPKKLEVSPLAKHDVEKIAKRILVEYGDDVINKAIEEGQIKIPSDIIVINKSIDSLSSEEVEQFKGKILYSTSAETYYYPYIVVSDAVAWVTILSDSIMYFLYSGDSENNDWYYDGDETWVFGTKLYKHHLIDSGGTSYNFILINNSPTPIDFSTYDTYEKIYNLIKDSIVKFYNPTTLSSILYDNNPKYFYSYEYDNVTDSFIYSGFDDWNLSETTDTVTEL